MTIAVLSNRITNNPADREENDLLANDVVSGVPGAINRMIERNMPLAVGKAKLFLETYPAAERIREDVFGDAFLGLTIAVNKLAEQGYYENPVGLMSKWITYTIGEGIDREFPQATEEEHRRRHRKKRPKTESFDSTIDAASTASMAAVASDIVVDPTSMVDLRDLIDSCCESDVERDIIRLRQYGLGAVDPDPHSVSEHAAMSDAEIAAALNIPVTTCYVLRRGVYARFLEKSGMKGEA